ncbi:MAG TPA: alpha/beta fold hydrolase [Thermoanaerobaculia bacterium]
MSTDSKITAREQAEIAAANASGRRPVVFVHGLWLHASSWDRWAEMFREAGYATLAPGWPDDPETVEASRQNPDVFAGKGVDEVTEHYAAIIRQLQTPPAIVGHSFGGMIAQKLLGLGLGAVGVAIDPAPFRGVLPLPFSALKSAFPVLENPANLHRAVMLTEEQFRFGFASAVSEEEAVELYKTYPIPGSGRPLFQAATANLDWTTEASVDTKNATRGPLLLISGEKDNTVPPAITHAEFKQYRKSPALTELQDIAGRGHSLTIDSGWREVADHALAFVQKHAG